MLIVKSGDGPGGHGYFLAVARKFRDPASRFGLLAEHRCGFRYRTEANKFASSISTKEKWPPPPYGKTAHFSTGGDGR